MASVYREATAAFAFTILLSCGLNGSFVFVSIDTTYLVRIWLATNAGPDPFRGHSDWHVTVTARTSVYTRLRMNFAPNGKTALRCACQRNGGTLSGATKENGFCLPQQVAARLES